MIINVALAGISPLLTIAIGNDGFNVSILLVKEVQKDFLL